MKKSLTCIFLAWMSLHCVAENQDVKNVKAETLGVFTEDVFEMLQTHSQMIDLKQLENTYRSFIERLKQYEHGANLEIASIAEQFILSFQEGPQSKDSLVEPISALGRLLKRSTQDQTCHAREDSYLLKRDAFQKQLLAMEEQLKERLPKHPVSYHRLMMESLAEGVYDVALYAYMKIAESRYSESI